MAAPAHPSKSAGRNVILFPAAGAANPADTFVRNLAASGQRSARARLTRFASLFNHTLESFPWARLTPGDVLAARAHLRDIEASRSTINMTLSHVRSVARTCRQLGLSEMSAETCAAILQVQGVRGSSLPAGRALTAAQIGALFESARADASAAGVRDLALLSALYYGGLRRDEVCWLRPEDYQARERRLRVRGKGDKEEWVYLEVKEARLALNRWTRQRGDVPGPLFCSLRRGGRLRLADAEGGGEAHARPLTGDAVYKIVRHRGVLAGVAPCTPHDLRRSAITNLLEGGADPLAVQEWARHNDPGTTKVYDRRRERAKRSCARRLRPAPVRPRPRRKPHRPKVGRPRMAAPLASMPKPRLLALAAVHGVEGAAGMTKEEIAAAIREKTS